ncbi:transporter substrate-binding domain-containing protein [Breoghania sp. L-A4]|uniref:substrate-binding periplasmic protein n=1 Tax=Breoghania sp. L-A4 TaxID=2304600 RepID=UPI0013C34D62|nr:transporter substrate-binding domain-containing protein [Breoghania sp. L-A4]
MRGISFFVILAVAVSFAVFFRAPDAIAADESAVVRVAADPWCPYNCNPGDAKPGFLIEIGREAFAMSGYEMRYEVMPWSRALRESYVGNVDAAVGATRATAPEHLFGSNMLSSDETIVFVRVGEIFDFTGVDSLKALRLGVIKDYTYDDNGPIDSYIAENRGNLDRVITVSSHSNLGLLFRMLLAGRIDAFLENRHVGTYMASALNVRDSIALVPTGALDFVSFAFTPNARGEMLVDAFDAGVTRLRETGRFEEILIRYGLNSLPE